MVLLIGLKFTFSIDLLSITHYLMYNLLGNKQAHIGADACVSFQKCLVSTYSRALKSTMYQVL